MHEMLMPDDPVAFIIAVYVNARRDLREPVVATHAAALVRRALPEAAMSESQLLSMIRSKATAEHIIVLD